MAQKMSREVRVLKKHSKTLQSDYPKDVRISWTESPFGWIRSRPSRQKGAIGERLVEKFFAEMGFDVKPYDKNDGHADRIIEGQPAEIKFSMLWQSGIYKFQQLRNQNYKFVICLGISPSDAHCWILPKREIKRQIRLGNIKPQHGGRRAKDTAWFSVKPDDPPEWLSEWGGSLDQAVKKFTVITGKRPTGGGDSGDIVDKYTK